jgi:hypothetical protein
MTKTRSWLHCCLLLIMAQAVFVVSLAAISSRRIPFEAARPFGAAAAIWIVGLAWMIARTGFSALGTDRPFAAWRERLIASRPILLRAFQIATLVGAAIALHGWAKSMIPYVVPYWADPFLADADKFAFGSDPWLLFRSELLGPLYSTFYVFWFPITFGTMGLIAFGERDNTRLILAFLMTLIVGGTFGQYLLASGGPIYFEGLGFGPRFHQLVATNDPVFNSFARYLWVNYQSGSTNLGTGISAMPSMHIALATWTVFAVRAIWRPLMPLAILYAIILWAASIASGWHYASDGIVGAGIAIVAFWLSGQWLPRPGSAKTRDSGAIIQVLN